MTATTPNTQPIVVGITGGIGSGKSEFVRALTQHGAVAFAADEAVHALYRRPAVISKVRRRFGSEVVGSDGQLDRNRIASIVFRDKGELTWLEDLLHPLVADVWAAFIDEQRALAEPPPMVVAEVPLLFEANLSARYDHVVLITAPLDLRIERIAGRSGGAVLAESRAARQLPEAAKAELADTVFVNDGDLPRLEAFADKFFRDAIAQSTSYAHNPTPNSEHVS